jgi:hypothetical protein
MFVRVIFLLNPEKAIPESVSNILILGSLLLTFSVVFSLGNVIQLYAGIRS